MVLVVAPLVEETFCRGWFQSFILGTEPRQVAAPDLFPSAVLFAAMHFTVLFAGVSPISLGVLLPFLIGLGLLTGWLRAHSGSLYPAMAAHAAFNVGGIVSGVFYVVAYRLLTGQLPTGLG